MNITNDKVTEYINKFYTPVSPEMMELREKAEQSRVPVILRETRERAGFFDENDRSGVGAGRSALQSVIRRCFLPHSALKS